MGMRRHSRSIHPSWLFAGLCAGIIIGTIGAFWLPKPLFVSVVWLVLGILCAGFSLWQKGIQVLWLILIAGVVIGLWRSAEYRQQLLPYEHLVGQAVEVQGRVFDDPDIGKSGEKTLRLHHIVIDSRSINGSIWVSMGQKQVTDIKRGDIVTVKGKLSAGVGSFAASIYRATLVRIERPVPGDVALRVRDWFADGVRQAIPEPEASLGVGYVAGQRRSLPEELDKALRATGLTHIVVASGYNLTILVGASRRLLAKISKFQAAFLSGGLTLSFMLITGLSPSMSRAGLVTGLGLLAWYYGRRFHPVVLLLLAAAVTLLINPAYGKGDLGWQLSFASFAGVLIVAPLLQRYFFGNEKPGILRQIFFETTCAWLCTVPLIILAFGQFSNVAILANLLVLPLVPLAMLLTFMAGIIALSVPALAALVGLPATLVLGYVTRVTTYLGSLPWAQTTLEIAPVGIVLYYGVLCAVCGYIWHTTRFRFLDRPTDENSI